MRKNGTVGRIGSRFQCFGDESDEKVYNLQNSNDILSEKFKSFSLPNKVGCHEEIF
jgi:hypothetical protein